jgi:hypothetical protein
MRRAKLHRIALVACLLAFGAPSSARASEPAIVWTDAATLPVSGRGFADAAGYQRLPDRFRGTIPERVWQLSTNSAGVVVTLRTDAAEIRLRWTTGVTQITHMPTNAVMGIDVYSLGHDADGRLDARYLGTAHARAEASHEWTAVAGLSPGERTIALYLPLYERVERLEIGVPEGASLAPADASAFFARPPVVVYGTSIAQGAAASRPGMAWPAILGRLAAREVVNLGFSATGRLDPGMAEALGEIDAAVYVLDCLPNLDPGEVLPRTLAFVRRLRELRPATPIVLVENITYPATRDRPWLAEILPAKNAALAEALATLRAEGVGGLWLVNADERTGQIEDETSDGIHPTDAGMRRHAERLARVLAEVLADGLVTGADRPE